MTITDDELKAMAVELCLLRGEQPNSVDRGGVERWERYKPLAEGALREAERLFALRQSSPPDGQTADGWQDISTAPKDGTELILLFDGGVWSGRWVQDEGWFETNNHPTDSWGFGELRPTMWRHYPGPPTKAPGEEH